MNYSNFVKCAQLSANTHQKNKQLQTGSSHRILRQTGGSRIHLLPQLSNHVRLRSQTFHQLQIRTFSREGVGGCGGPSSRNNLSGLRETSAASAERPGCPGAHAGVCPHERTVPPPVCPACPVREPFTAPCGRSLFCSAADRAAKPRTAVQVRCGSRSVRRRSRARLSFACSLSPPLSLQAAARPRPSHPPTVPTSAGETRGCLPPCVPADRLPGA